MSVHNEKTDLEIAQQFFDMLKSRGFGVNMEDYSGRKPGDEDFDIHHGVSFELTGSHGVFASFDFLNQDLYRVSGFTQGNWQDEVDWKKYK